MLPKSKFQIHSCIWPLAGPLRPWKWHSRRMILCALEVSSFLFLFCKNPEFRPIYVLLQNFHTSSFLPILILQWITISHVWLIWIYSLFLMDSFSSVLWQFYIVFLFSKDLVVVMLTTHLINIWSSMSQKEILNRTATDYMFDFISES